MRRFIQHEELARDSRFVRQSNALAAASSMTLSRPKPTSATLSAASPDQTASTASMAL